MRRRGLVMCVLAAAAAALVIAPNAGAALRSPALVSSCPAGSTYSEQTVGVFTLEGCLVTESSRFITAPGTTAAELNGLDVALPSGAQLAMMRTGNPQITSSGASVTIRLNAPGTTNDVTLYQGSLNLTQPLVATRGTARAAAGSTFAVDLPVGSAAQLIGIDIQGSAHLVFSSGRTDVTVNLKFPSLLGGATIAAQVSLSDGQGLQLSSLDLNSGTTALPLGPIPAAVKELQFHFTPPSTVKLGGTLIIPGIKPQSFGVIVTITNGALQSITGSVGGANLPLGGPFFLQGGDVTVGVNPLTIGGDVQISAGPVDELTNAFILKYTGGFKFTFSNPSIYQLIGTSQLLGIGPLQGGSGTDTITYSSDQILSVNRKISLTLPFLTMNGTLGGSVSPQGFQLAGSEQGSYSALGLTLAGASGQFKANGTGWGVCLTGTVFGISATGQVRADWGHDPAPSLGCDLGRFAARTATARAAAGASAVVVHRGATNAAIRVQGTSGAPSFDLALADGTVLHVRNPTANAQPVGGRAIVRAEDARTTTVYVNNPPAGSWTVTPVAGQPLAAVLEADNAPPAVRASVSGTGKHRTLHWNVDRLDGGRLEITELQAHGRAQTLLVTRRTHGTASFAVPFGPAGRRRLSATITDPAGIPRARMLVGSYVAPKPFVPQPPRDIKVKFSRAARTLTFSVVPPVNKDFRPDFWYYRIQLADGRLLFTPGVGPQRITVDGVTAKSAFTVGVNGVDDVGLQGRARVEHGTA